MSERKPYPSDVSDDEWAFVAPYLTLMTEDAPQREHPLREVFNGRRYIVRGGIAWRMTPNDLPPWYTVYQQTQRWLKAGVFEAMVHDLREVLRLAAGRSKDNYLAAQYRRLAARRGKKRAAVAVAHSILAIAYHLIERRTEYVDLGATYFDHRKKDTVQQQLVKRLEKLGFKVALEPLETAA